MGSGVNLKGKYQIISNYTIIWTNWWNVCQDLLIL
jgi:hypothetical protein